MTKTCHLCRLACCEPAKGVALATNRTSSTDDFRMKFMQVQTDALQDVASSQ